MDSMITKYIFVDLDETLFHSRFLGVKPTKAMRAIMNNGEKLVKLINYQDGEILDYEFYGSCLRPGAHDLLTALRAIPNSKVMVLTSSVEDYAQANNRTHELGFAHTDIYARAKLERGTVPDLGIADPTSAKFYLIDNLPRHENRIKVRWMQQLADNAEVNYIKVPEFFSAKQDRHLDSDLIADILLKINDLDNS